ncbi:MAG: hypothetical protein M3N98_14765, partial [Actinomycetota bacterium]|nr:hypothetical protein [Actinomycetota bacterium]
MTSTELIGSSVWEQSLYHHFISHVSEEADLLDDYQRAADESQSSAFRYLVSIIVDEERRHHSMFRQLAKTLAAEVDRGPEPSAVPRLGHWGFERARIAELTESFLSQERWDMAGLKELEVELAPVKDTTMWPLLVQLMEADTAKHIQILEFIKAQLARSWHAAEADWAGIENGGDEAVDGR